MSFASDMSLSVKVTSFGLATFSYSAVQPHFEIKLPWSLGYIYLEN